jgi:hypothetical protein
LEFCDHAESAIEPSPLLEGVHFFALEGKDMGVLWKVRPAFVIVYDPDIAFVRQLEVRSTITHFRSFNCRVLAIIINNNLKNPLSYQD